MAARKEVLHAVPTSRFRQWLPLKNRGLSPLWENGTLMVDDDFHPAGGRDGHEHERIATHG